MANNSLVVQSLLDTVAAGFETLELGSAADAVEASEMGSMNGAVVPATVAADGIEQAMLVAVESRRHLMGH